MSFGQSSKEKANDTTIAANQKQIGDISASSATKGDKSFKWFKQAATPAKDFYTNLLSGDRSAIEQFLGPEMSAITNQFKGAREAAMFDSRGGGKASTNEDLAVKEASTKSDAILKARPEAANALTNMSSIFSSASQGFTGEALSGLGTSANIGFDLNKEQAAIRQQMTEMLSNLGSTAGEAIGMGFGK